MNEMLQRDVGAFCFYGADSSWHTYPHLPQHQRISFAIRHHTAAKWVGVYSEKKNTFFLFRLYNILITSNIHTAFNQASNTV